MSTHSQPTESTNPSNISEYESSWRLKFPKLFVLLLSIVQLVFILVIFVLEIASLAVLTIQSTGVGIWCAVAFLTASILTFLTYKKDGSRLWATIALIAQFVLLIFTFILIGITGNFVQTVGYTYSSTYNYISYDLSGSNDPFVTKYKLVQAQLAFGILLMFSGFTYVGIYIYVTIVALWRPHHTLDTNHLFHE